MTMEYMPGRRAVIAGFTASLALAAGVVPVSAQGDAAQGFPKQSMKLLVGFTAGGGNDIIGRVVAQKLSERYKVPVVVENKPGAGGALAAETVARAMPDGHTLLVAPVGTMVFNPVLFAKLPYDPQKSFVPVTMLADYPLYLSVSTTLPVKNVKELIAYAKANPTKANYASTSGVFQLTNELFKLRSGTAFEQIPFKSSAEMITALINGQATIGFIDPTPLIPQVKAGKIRLLATSAAKRSADFPDVPTMAEAGVEGVVVSGYSSLVAPAATPKAIVKKLEADVNEILKLGDVKERFKQLAVVPVGGTGEAVAQSVAKDLPMWREIAAKAGITPK